LAPFGDIFLSVFLSFGFFQRGSSAMMTLLGLGVGVSIVFLSGSLVIFASIALRVNHCWHKQLRNICAAP
jgi:hypothetical protein